MSDITLYDYAGHKIRLGEHGPRMRAVVGSGVPLTAGQFIFDEPQELRSRDSRHEQYRRMQTTDPYIAEVLRSNILPLMGQATWDVQSGVEVADPLARTPEESRAAEVRDLVAANLYGEENGSFGSEYLTATSWFQRLREITMFLTHGFSLFHKQKHLVGTSRVFKRLLWLEPHTITKWNMDANDDLISVTRNYRRSDGGFAASEELPAEELALYTWDLVGNRLEGTPLLRSMWGSWVRKEFLLKCKMIAAQRSSVGAPVAVRDATAGDEEGLPDVIEDFLQSLMGSGLESAYLSSGNPTLKIDYLRQQSQDLQKFDKLTQQEDLGIAHGGGTKAGMLGELPGGARATGEVQQGLAYVLTKAVAHIIAEQDRRGVGNLKGCIQELVEDNYAGEPRMPVVEVNGIDPDEATRNVPLLVQAKAAGMIKARPQTEAMLMERLGFKLPDELFEDDPVGGGSPIPSGGGQDDDDGMPERGTGTVRDAPGDVSPAAGGGGGQSGTGGAGGNAGGGSGVDDISRNFARRVGLRLAIEDLIREPSMDIDRDQARAAGYSRRPTMFEERVLALGVIKTTMAASEQQTVAVLKSAKTRMIEDFVERGRAGKITDANLGSLRRSRPKGVASMERGVREQFMATVSVGRRHARDEIDRQEAQAKQVAERKRTASSMSEMFTIRLADGNEIVPPGAPIPLVPPTAIPGLNSSNVIEILMGEAATEAQVTATTTIDTMWGRLMEEGIGEFRRLERQGVTGPELWNGVQAHLESLSDAGVTDAGRATSTVAYNQGRDVTAKAAKVAGDAQWALRSEVLDPATCENCASLDGLLAEIGTPEYESEMPPAKCLGQERCRGIIVVISGEFEEGLRT